MRRVLLSLFALFFAGALSALWYASEKGFTRKWRGYVSEEFRKRGVEVTLRQLTLDPLRGLVAKEVRVFDTRDRRRTLAVIDEMALQVNYANLIRGKAFLDALELRDASLSLPLDPKNPRGPKVEITRLNARLFLPPQQIYLAHANAEIFGLRISAAGRIIHPLAFRPRIATGEAVLADYVARIFAELAALKFEGEPPVLNVTFSGDLAEPDLLFVDVTLWGERLRRQNYALRSLYVAASYRGGVLDLKQLLAVDDAGELRLSGLWEPAAHQAHLQLRSSLDASALARACGDFPWLNDLIFYTPPRIDLRVDMSFGESPSLQVLGHLDTSKFAYRTMIFERANADFSWAGGRWSLRDVQLVRSGGEEVTGDAMLVPGDFRARLRSTMNPKVLHPWLSGQAAETLAQFEFALPPQLTLEARGTTPAAETLTVDGEVTLGAVSFRGVPAGSTKAKMRFENRVLSIAPFHIERNDGSGDGNLRFDFRPDGDRTRAGASDQKGSMDIAPVVIVHASAAGIRLSSWPAPHESE
jgi:hypothetical protein